MLSVSFTKKRMKKKRIVLFNKAVKTFITTKNVSSLKKKFIFIGTKCVQVGVFV